MSDHGLVKFRFRGQLHVLFLMRSLKTQHITDR